MSLAGAEDIAGFTKIKQGDETEMKKMKTLIVATAMATAAMVFAGCSNSNSGTNEPSPQATQEAPANSAAPGDSLKASETPIDLTVHMAYRTIVFNEEWPVFKKAAELTNVTLKGTNASVNNDPDAAFNIMMSSGEMPDIVQASVKNIRKFIKDDAFMPLKDLIDEHAPNLKAFLEERSDVKAFMTSEDGDMYFIPFVPDGPAAQGYFIRQDWLDKLGLKAPTTVEEFYNVLVAFRDQDPNGNGKKDEVPFFVSDKIEVFRLSNLFDVRYNWYAEDGKVTWNINTPEFKNSMIQISNWYEEGLIDKEAITRGGKARDVLLGDNVGGSTRGWFGSTSKFNDTLKDAIPGFSFQPIEPPASTSGKSTEETTRAAIGGSGWALAGSNENPVESIKYLDFWFSEEGRRLMNFGVEGEHYDLVDGKPVFKENILKGESPVNQLLNEAGAQIEIGYHQDYEYERQWTNPIALEAIDSYVNNGYLVKNNLPELVFTDEEQKILTAKLAPLNTYVDEMRVKWLLGGESVEAGFDQYLAKLKSFGYDEVVQIHQAAYDRMMSIN